MAAARTTSEPKEVRMEVRLSGSVSEKLEYCSTTLGYSKGEIIRLGIEMMYKRADREKELNDAEQTREELIEQANEERENMVYEEAYEEAYADAYAEEYAKLIVDPEYTPSEAEDAAAEYAKDIAKDAAKEAVKDFWKT